MGVICISGIFIATRRGGIKRPKARALRNSITEES